MANTSLYTLAQTNGSDAYTGCVEDQTNYSPEFYSIPAIAHAGTSFQTVARTGLPSSGFRLGNQAVTSSASTYKQSINQMFYIDSPIVVDEMIYKGSDGTAGDLLYLESQGALQSVVNTIGRQTWYGTSTDGSNGFVGCRSQLLISGSGTTAVTASALQNTTTAFGLWLNPQGVSYAVGKYGEIAINQVTRQFITTGGQNSGNTPAGYWAYVTNVAAYVGLSMVSEYSVFGITGINYANPLTDKLSAQLLATVPLQRRAGFTWFMNRLAYTSLQLSRTAINYQPAGAKNGSPAFSPPPLEMDGHPIYITDNITNTEDNR